MSKLLTGNVFRHLAAQVGTVVLLSAVAGLAKIDWSALGAYAPSAQILAAFLASLVNEALGTAPKE